MVIVAEVRFSFAEVHSVIEPYLKVSPLPGDVIRIGPYFHIDSLQNVRALTIYRFDSGNVEDATAFLRERYASFAELPNVECTIAPWMDGKEAIAKLDNAA